MERKEKFGGNEAMIATVDGLHKLGELAATAAHILFLFLMTRVKHLLSSYPPGLLLCLSLSAPPQATYYIMIIMKNCHEYLCS